MRFLNSSRNSSRGDLPKRGASCHTRRFYRLAMSSCGWNSHAGVALVPSERQTVPAQRETTSRRCSPAVEHHSERRRCLRLLGREFRRFELSGGLHRGSIRARYHDITQVWNSSSETRRQGETGLQIVGLPAAYGRVEQAPESSRLVSSFSKRG